MKLHKDYCSHCPHFEEVNDGKRTGRYIYEPQKCHYCNPKTFTDKLGAYVNLEHDNKEFRRKMRDAEGGLVFSHKRQQTLFNDLKTNINEGDIRIIALCGVSVVLDWSHDSLRIRFANTERNPDA